MIHTSESIQKLHPEIYQELFSTSDCVVSGYFSFNWFPGNIGSNKKSIKAKQKLPLQCWIGLQAINDQKLSLSSSSFFSHSNNIFTNRSYQNIDPTIEQSLVLCYDWFSQNSNSNKGYSIKILSEIERGYGFALSGTVMMTLCMALAVATGIIKSEDCANLNHPIIQQLYALACQMTQIAKYDSISFAPLSTLSCEKEPLFYCFDDTQLYNYHYGSIAQLFPQNTILDTFPFDVVLLSSGKPTNTKYIKTINKSDHKILDQVQESFIQGFGKPLYQQINGDISLYQTLHQTSFVLGAELLNTFKIIYETGDDLTTNMRLISQINDLGYLSRIIEQHDVFYNQIQYAITQLNHRAAFGIMPMYSSKGGGTYILVSNHTNLGQIAQQVCDMLRGDYPDICTIYSSQQQGKVGGITCHQLVSNGVFSHHVDKYDLSYADNQGNSTIGSMEEIMKQYSSEALIIDTINNKILCKGTKLTSKQLHSQITTVEVLQGLLDHPDHTISNDQLAPSSLTKQQNQMLGKIILPLQKVTQEYRGTKLPLECHGNLRHFTLSLGQTPVPIGIIKSLS